tara:strand:+ start:2565 stop:2918 length:354 start_codon:yes stop_codon:yes gene_type:complete
MPPKKEKKDDKAFTLAELKRIIKKYDDLMGIDPKGKSVAKLREEIEAVGYTIDDGRKRVVRLGKVKDKKKRPVKIDLPAPPKRKPAKSKAEKDKEMREKVIKYILANKDVLKDERLK